MPVPMPVRTTLVAFDLDNTLVDRDAAFQAALDGWLLPGQEGVRHSIIQLDASGYTPRAEFTRGLASILDGDEAEGERLWEEIRSRMIAAIQPDVAINAALEQLGQRVSLAVVSNGSREVQRAKLERAGLDGVFATVLISEEVGVAKPDAAIFRRLFPNGTHRPEESLFVGDHPWHDVAGAQKVGMRTYWVSRGRALPTEIQPDLTIETIGDFPWHEQF